LNRIGQSEYRASMKRLPAGHRSSDTFETVRMVGLALPDVEATTKYDGSPDYHRNHPVVLVRLSQIDSHALRDLLSMSWRLSVPKARKRGRM
jgi:hypothetical protein